MGGETADQVDVPSASGSSSEVHPFVRAWRVRDQREWGSALAPDVVLKSPLLAKPFVGRHEVAELYGTLFEVFDDLEITDEIAAGDTRVFYWQGTVDGRPVEGADFVRANADGDIAEIRVLMRPLATLGIVMAGVGTVMGRRDGGLRGTVARLAARPLRLLFQSVQAVATRLGQRG